MRLIGQPYVLTETEATPLTLLRTRLSLRPLEPDTYR